jgi:hypothetical protein
MRRPRKVRGWHYEYGTYEIKLAEWPKILSALNKYRDGEQRQSSEIQYPDTDCELQDQEGLSTKNNVWERKEIYRIGNLKTRVTEHKTEMWETSKPKIADEHRMEQNKAEITGKKENTFISIWKYYLLKSN